MTHRDDTFVGRRPHGTAVPCQCTLDGFTDEVTASKGIRLTDLGALTTLHVRTVNSLYRVVALDPAEERILIQGGAYFPVPTEARLAGASLGGSMLKLSWLGCGLRMEVCVDGQRVVTSPVRSIEITSETELPGPF